MSLIYFHRFLIFCAILFALFFAYKGWDEWRGAHHASHLVQAVVSVVAAVGLALYLRTVKLPKSR